MITEPPYFEIPPFYAIVTAVSVVVAYMLGLSFKMIYYKFFHPNLGKKPLIGDDTEESPTKTEPMFTGDVPDSAKPMRAFIQISSDSDADVTEFKTASPPDTKRCNKRMRKLAGNFYS